MYALTKEKGRYVDGNALLMSTPSALKVDMGLAKVTRCAITTQDFSKLKAETLLKEVTQDSV